MISRTVATRTLVCHGLGRPRQGNPDRWYNIADTTDWAGASFARVG